MLYPQKLNQKKSNIIIRSFLIVSFVIAFTLILINKIVSPQIHWAALANAGIIYTWITVIYAINKNTNIAGHVVLQGIAVSILTIYIDYKIGFRTWSINIAIPIIIMIANVTMLVLTIVSYKKYIRYALYQLIICACSFIPLFLIYEGIVQYKILSLIASGISLLNLILTLCLCARDVKEEVVRKFHI